MDYQIYIEWKKKISLGHTDNLLKAKPRICVFYNKFSQTILLDAGIEMEDMDDEHFFPA